VIAFCLWPRKQTYERNEEHAVFVFSDGVASVRQTSTSTGRRRTLAFRQLAILVQALQRNPKATQRALLLVNAIYFKGQWQLPFNKQNTKPDVFSLDGGEQKEVQMMSRSGSYLYYHGNDFQAVALPYGQGTLSMYVFLPDEKTSLEQFQQDLTTENWEVWMKNFRIMPGDLKLPRFKVEWDSKLNEALKSLGMAEAFDSTRANFSQMAELNGGNVFLSEVRQKSWCEVNEEGTVAAAATSARASVASFQPQRFSLKVDRPFFFAIRDNRSGVVLFMGSITNPA
jgi:serpin B